MSTRLGRVLVIDDEQGIRDLLLSELTASGYEVETSEDGLSGVTRATTDAFDVVVSDITMPGITGVEALRRIRDVDPDVQVVMVTGYATVDVAVECMKLGAFDFLRKPYEMEELLQVIERAMKSRQLGVSNALFRATQSLLACQDEGEIARRVLELASERLVAPFAAFLVGPVDTRGGRLLFRPEGAIDGVASAWDALMSPTEPTTLPLGGDPHVWSVHSLSRSEQFLGALVLAQPAWRRSLNRAELEWVEVLGSQAAVALENATLHTKTIQQAETVTGLYRETVKVVEELRQRNAELDAFVYSCSHDLRSPLVSLQGMVGLLVDELGEQLSERGRHYLQRLRDNVVHLERLIGDLHEVARAGRDGRAPEATDLDGVVREVLDEMSETLQARGIRVELGELLAVHAVRVHVEQVVRNLLGNAVKFLGDRPQPTIAVGSIRRGDQVETWVADNGVGIDPSYHEKIFEMFERLNDVQVEGSGMGLAIVKKIIEGAGGRVWVESVKGKGATFRFTLPSA